MLINPSFIAPKTAGFGLSFPLGLGYLGAALKRAGHEVIGLDAAAQRSPTEIADGFIRYGLNQTELSQRIKEIQPDIVGISCFFSSRFPAVLETAKTIKSTNSGIKIIVGGAHPSIMPEQICSHAEIDYAMIGEAEESLVEFIDALEKRQDFSSIDGLAFRRNGQVIVNPKTHYIDNLDSLGFPDWSLLDFERYLTLNEDRWGLGHGRYAPVITSRSCPYRCNFCSVQKVMGQKYRARSAEHVLGEIEILVDRYGVNELSFEDDNLTFDKNRFIQICEGMIGYKFGIRWNTPNGVHVGSLDSEMIELARAAGCDSLNLAIESGDEHMRNHVIKKRLKTEKIYEVTRACRNAGIKVNAYFVIGMPGESEQSINNTKRLIKDLHFNNLSIFVATPIPGTRLYDECLENGYIKPGQFDNEFISNQAIIFTQPAIVTPQFDGQKVNLWRHRLFNAYYVSSLRNGLFYWLKENPRAFVSMLAKVILYAICGEQLSFRLTEKIRDLIKK